MRSHESHEELIILELQTKRAEQEKAHIRANRRRGGYGHGRPPSAATPSGRHAHRVSSLQPAAGQEAVTRIGATTLPSAWLLSARTPKTAIREIDQETLIPFSN